MKLDDIKQDEKFIEFCTDRNLSKDTQKTAGTKLLKYCRFNNMTLAELYNEADIEEEKGIRLKRRTILKRLKKYKNYLMDEKMASSSIIEYFNLVRSFYKHFIIEIPPLPPLKLPETQLTYEDIPNKKHIKEALNSTSNKLHKAMILFQYSSCSAMAETLSITCQMFVDATREYHDEENIVDVIKEIENKKDIVPFFLLSRQKKKHEKKGGYKYYTCCTPESTEYIIGYLKTRENLRNEDKLFDIGVQGVESFYRRLNDKIGWGYVGEARFFRSHSMRYAGNTAIENEADGDLFSGRKRNRIHEIYFKKNPKKIKELYIQYIPDLSIRKTKVNQIDDESTKKIKKELEVERQARLEAQSEAQEAKVMAQEALDTISLINKRLGNKPD